MPSVEQIVNDIKAILNQIETDTSLTAQEAGQIHGDTTAINATTSSLLSVTQAGFVNLSQGLATVVDRLDETNSLLAINDAQNRVMMCWLGILAELGCEQVHRLDRQIELEESIADSAAQVRKIMELVHSRETVELHREHELVERIEECCPPERPEPKPCFEPCPVDIPPLHEHQIPSFAPLEPATPTRQRPA